MRKIVFYFAALLLALTICGTHRAQNSLPNMSPSASPTTTSVSVLPKRSEQELRDLERLAQERQLEDAIIQWAQRRFWLIAVLAVLIGFFGVRSLVRELIAGELKDAMRVTAAAQAASDQAREAAKVAQSEAEEYEAAVEKLRKTANDVQADLLSLRALIEAEAANARKAAEIGLGGMQRQLDTLSAAVADVAAGRASSKDTVQRQSEVKEESAAAQSAFARRSKYNVAIFSDDEDSDVANRLSATGYKTSRFPPGFSGIPKNTLLYSDKAKPVLKEIIQLVQEAIGAAPNVHPFPFEGITGKNADVYFIPESKF
jgi:hypothetical protein